MKRYPQKLTVWSKSNKKSFLSINFIADFCPHLGSFFVFFLFFYYVSAKFHLRPSSGD